MQIHDSPPVSQFISNNTTSNTPYRDIFTLPTAPWVTYIFDSNIFLTVLWIYSPHCVNELLGIEILWWIATWKLYSSKLILTIPDVKLLSKW
jgi:hypothetical protein